MNLNQMTFGVEIECTIPENEILTAGTNRYGDRSYGTLAGFSGWQVKDDGSLSTNGNRYCREIVSPVLSGVDGLTQLRGVAALLASKGVKVNRSCGFHFHIGFNGSVAQLRKLSRYVAHHEKALFAITGTHARETNSYCKSIKPLVSLGTMRTLGDRDSRQHRDRYHVLNITNLIHGGKPTVEFRVFAGTVNIAKIEAYVQICLGLVQKAMTVSKESAWDAPENSAKQLAQNVTAGVWAVRQLLFELQWFSGSTTKVPYGVFDATLVTTYKRELYRLAKKYDGVERATAAEPDAE